MVCFYLAWGLVLLVTVFFKNGVPVRGQILATNKFTVLMIVHGKQQLVCTEIIKLFNLQ
ncbi:hypothetical protein CN638_15950 [Bacillus toyonensis]|nr:hypothetical protein CN638_15950 [Bacillus toyonensis]